MSEYNVPALCAPVRNTVRENLAMYIKNAEERLAELKLALSLLDKNPDLEQLTDALRRAGV